ADGPSDIPVFSLVRQNGGHCCAVYDPAVRESYGKAIKLQNQGRVEHHAPADYQENSPLWLWLCATLHDMIDGMQEQAQARLKQAVGRTPASY
ncbi:MAG: haloacid dehalogenase-like hydrolase, partial [Planctomycetota bacterium]